MVNFKPGVNGTGAVLKKDVFYGRAVTKIPRSIVIGPETAQPLELRRALLDFEETAEKKYNLTVEDHRHLVGLAFSLLAENRSADTVFREWLDDPRVAGAEVFVLSLTNKQRLGLKGTTVEAAFEEMTANVDILVETAGNFSQWVGGVSRSDAQWALAVIMMQSRIIHPHPDEREKKHPRMRLIPLPALLDLPIHMDPAIGLPFQEEVLLDSQTKREQEVIVQIAKRDLPKGEPMFVWPGRFSNSELLMRRGESFPKNPIGIGRNVTTPPNWSPRPDAPIMKEYAKYNCTSLDDFEMRFSPRGFPHRTFVRCYRLSWFLANGWYNPGLQKRKNEMSKWPPPKKYAGEDWLSWTQADAELTKIIRDYCSYMRQNLKENMETELADDFKVSTDPKDKAVWKLRVEETKTFKNCLSVTTR